MRISYALENLRSLHSTPEIELRPITILVGRNSAGKSTFLRSLALLRQSVEARSSAPILWYGDYVDFGDFASAVSHRDTSKEVHFKFVAEDFTVRTREFDATNYLDYDDYRYTSRARRRREYSTIQLDVSLGEQLGRTVRRRIQLSDRSQDISLTASFAKDGRVTESFKVNGFELSDLLPGHAVIFDASDIFSSAILFTNVRDESRTLRRATKPVSAFSSYISALVRSHVDKRILSENLAVEARRMLRYPRLTKEALRNLSAQSDTVSFKRFYDSLVESKRRDLWQKINIACATNYMFQSISDSGDFFRNFFIQTTYLGPARARSERYYRFQELEVSEIAPDGHNLPMFLGSLPSSQLSGFSDWVEELFGFGVSVQRNEGHISIQLIRGELNVNVADTGYGVSQLLPVLAQIWWSSKSSMRYRRSRGLGAPFYPITMEQPELHLHPAHQAQLADALLNALPDAEDGSRSTPIFVVETHSEALINRLGELIEEKKLSAEDVQVVIFSSDDKNPNSTKIATSKYDESGVLNDWPFGFFSY